MNHPNDRHYAQTHEWIVETAPQEYTLGISDYAQQALGDVVHAGLPQVGQRVTAGEACCVLESVKAASDVHAAVTGEVVAVNALLADAPELINDDCYGQGWLFKIKSAETIENLISASEYEASLD